jgi:predicted carbohydrate-binding protein with CBM5 and CBM33 domain
MFGQNESYRPGQQTYRIDGMPISQSQFMLEVNSGRIGGAFGLLFMTTRMSTREVGRWQKTVSWNETYGTDNADFTATTTHTTRQSSSYTTGIVYEQNWSLSSLIRIFQTRQTQTQQQKIQPSVKSGDIVG